jgi:hypothetical protein
MLVTIQIRNGNNSSLKSKKLFQLIKMIETRLLFENYLINNIFEFIYFSFNIK